MKRFLKEYFIFSHSELRVLLILSGLILMAFTIRMFIPALTLSEQLNLTAADSLAIQTFINSMDSASPVNTGSEAFFTEIHQDPLFRPFNPNTVTLSELKSMNFPENIARNLLKYRNSGGCFFQKEDMRKIYGVTDSIYRLWESCFIIPQTNKTAISRPGQQISTYSTIELNTADSVQLMDLPGIGTYFARKILAYRERLGGFVEKEQLLEIYGMDTTRWQEIIPYLQIDPGIVTKININSATTEAMQKHPYISRKMALGIMKYRDFRGTIDSVGELRKNRIIDETRMEQLRPYLYTGSEN